MNSCDVWWHSFNIDLKRRLLTKHEGAPSAVHPTSFPQSSSLFENIIQNVENIFSFCCSGHLTAQQYFNFYYIVLYKADVLDSSCGICRFIKLRQIQTSEHLLLQSLGRRYQLACPRCSASHYIVLERETLCNFATACSPITRLVTIFAAGITADSVVVWAFMCLPTRKPTS